MGLFGEAFDWLTTAASWQGDGGITSRLVEHVWFSAIVVLAAIVVALPVGVVTGHLRRGRTAVVLASGGARAVPTLGLLTLFGLALGIGLVAPFLALVVLAIPSILAGAYSGIEGVDRRTVDAARATGFSEHQLVRSIELPIAAPVIFGGIRAAMLQVIATATLAAYTADIGLGRFLFSGIKTQNYAMVLGGALLVMLLALIVDLALAGTQRRLQRRART